MAFKNAKGMSASSLKAQQEAREKAEKEAAQNGKPRIKLQPGPNFLMVLPSFSEVNAYPYRPVLAHYNPFHICLRPDPYEDSEGNIVTDKRFGACPRCQAGWDAYAARRDELNIINAGMKPDDAKEALQGDSIAKAARSNLASEQLMFQAVNMTPFFKIEKVKSSYRVTVDKDKLKYMDEFAAVIAGRSEGKGLPEDLLESAKAGVSLMLIAKTWGNRLRTAITDRFISLNDSDPFLDPVNNLVRIDLVSSGKQMNGQDVMEWQVSLQGARELPGFTLSDTLMEAIEDKAVDIWDLKEEDETIEALSRAFKKAASKEALMDWLAEKEWQNPSIGLVAEQEVEATAPSAPSLAQEEESPIRGKALFANYGISQD